MELDASVVWDFAGELVGTLTQRKGRTLATVTRIDPDGTTWVTTDGDGEAPAVGVAAGVAVGDTVALEWDGATMGIRANVSDPAPTGAVVRHAQRVASAAQKVAEAVNQHFFTDTHGIHVTEATQEDWEQSHTGPNVLINSIGQLFRDGLNNLLTMTTENGARALTIWDGLGNNAANVLAVFGEIVRIGRANAAHVDVSETSMSIMQDSDRLYEVAADGISVNVYAGGSTKAAGVNYTAAYEVALLDWLNRNCTVSDGIIYDSNDTDTGMTVGAINNVMDPSGNPYSTAYVEGIYYSPSTGKFYDLPQLVAMAEVPTAPTHVEMGGVGIDMANSELGVISDNLTLSKGGDLEITGALTAGSITGIERGSVGQTTSVPAGGYANVAVTFDRPYDSTPTVVVGMLSTSTSSEIGLCSVALESASATGFTARLFNAGASARRPSFCWIAMG